MLKCEVCGNEYDKAFTVTMNGKTHVAETLLFVGADVQPSVRNSFVLRSHTVSWAACHRPSLFSPGREAA